MFGHFYQRYVLGEWIGSDSTIYDNFDIKTHIISHFDIPKTWPRYRAVDFGYRAPFFCGWFTIALEDVDNTVIKRGDIILYRELYYTERTIAVNAQRILDFSKYPDGTPEKYKTTICDWDAGDRAELESKGIRTEQANKDITFGIQIVRQKLGNNDITRGMIVKPSFYIFENSLIEQDPKIRIDISQGTCLRRL